jgi:hypothetical protein
MEDQMGSLQSTLSELVRMQRAVAGPAPARRESIHANIADVSLPARVPSQRRDVP